MNELHKKSIKYLWHALQMHRAGREDLAQLAWDYANRLRAQYLAQMAIERMCR